MGRDATHPFLSISWLKKYSGYLTKVLTYDMKHGGVIAVKPNPFLECEFATLLLTRALTNGSGLGVGMQHIPF